MPYILVNLSRSLSENEEINLCNMLGKKISTIPNKTEKSLMVDISDNRVMFLAGKSSDCAYVDVRLYGKAEAEYKKALTEQIFEILSEIDIDKDNVYITISEFENWGLKGYMK